MNFWHKSVTHESEHFVTTHLTEAGALRAAIYDIMEFMGLEDGEARMNRDQDVELPTEHKVIDKMSLEELRHWWPIYGEETWDNHYGYDVQIVRSSLEA